MVYTLPLMSVSVAVNMAAFSMTSAPFKFTLKLCSNGLDVAVGDQVVVAVVSVRDAVVSLA